MVVQTLTVLPTFKARTREKWYQLYLLILTVKQKFSQSSHCLSFTSELDHVTKSRPEVSWEHRTTTLPWAWHMLMSKKGQWILDKKLRVPVANTGTRKRAGFNRSSLSENKSGGSSGLRARTHSYIPDIREWSYPKTSERWQGCPLILDFLLTQGQCHT